MHYGNIGAFIAGISALIIAASALDRGPAALTTPNKTRHPDCGE
jgi:hypothetical protein